MNKIIDVIEEINKFPLLSVFTFLLGIIMSYIFYRKSLREKKLKILKRTIRLINNFQSQVSKLSVFYENEKLEKLSITRLVLWNNGKVTIENTDIASLEPLIIKSLENVKIIDYKLFQIVDEANNIVVFHDKISNVLKINFEYFDKNQGFIIDIYHNGSNSTDILLSGKLKGCTINEEKYIPTVLTLGQYLKFKRTTMKRILGYFTVFFSVFFFVGEIINSKSFVLTIILSVFFIFYIYIGYFLLRKRVPKSLNKFEDDIL